MKETAYVFGYVALGAIIIIVLPPIIDFSSWSPQWFQAIGSVLAILVSVAVVYGDHYLAKVRDAEKRKAERSSYAAQLSEACNDFVNRLDEALTDEVLRLSGSKTLHNMMFATDGGYGVLRSAPKRAHLFEERERNAIITLSHDVEILRLVSENVVSESPSLLGSPPLGQYFVDKMADIGYANLIRSRCRTLVRWLYNDFPSDPFVNESWSVDPVITERENN